MTLAEQVEAKLVELKKKSNPIDALLEAERLADLYADVKPIPYVIPLGRLSEPLSSFQNKDC